MKKIPASISVSLILPQKLFPLFIPLLQSGFRVKVQVGCSLLSLLVDQFGLSRKFVDERIRTIFLDGNPMDDLGKAVVRDGSVLALSAAMPGLAGATLRRGSVVAGMRSPLPPRAGAEPISSGEGLIVVKLFNFLIPELGPAFLKRRIFLTGEEWKEFRKSLPEETWEDLKEREGTVPKDLDPASWVSFSVKFINS